MTPARRILPVANGILGLVSRWNQRLFELGLRRRHRAGLPVISVGNIAAGGTGKTPLVAALAKLLAERGKLPAILTRGYGRRVRRPVLISPGQSPGWREVGDEPALLARALPHIPIAVDPDRVRGAATVIRETRATHLVLDDGFQHWRLHRDLDLVAVNADDPLAERGFRREPPSALARADAVIVTRLRHRTQADEIRAALRRWTAHAPIIFTELAVRALHRGDRALPAEALKDLPVVALAGIGTPEGFVTTLQAAGARVTERFFFPDHHPFSDRELSRALDAAAGVAARVVTTQKDFMRLPSGFQDEVEWVEVETVAVSDELGSILDGLVER